MTRPRITRARILLAGGGLLTAVAILALVRVGIPTDTSVRIEPWVVDPIDTRFEYTDVPLAADEPVTIELATGVPAISRIELFTQWAADVAEPQLQVRFFDPEDDRTIATVSDQPVANLGITTIAVPPGRQRRLLGVELRTTGPEVVLRGYEQPRRGVAVSAPGTPTARDLGLRTFGSIASPIERLRLAAERTLLRWPTWNQTLAPIALLMLFAATCVAVGYAFRLALPDDVAPRQLAATVATAALVVAPFVLYVLQVR